MSLQRDASTREELSTELRIWRKLAGIGRLFTNAQGVDEVRSEVANAIGQIIDFDRIVIASVNRDREPVTPLYIAGGPVKGSFPRGHHPLSDDSVARRLTNPGGPMLASTGEQAVST